jgi:uncharacterized protein
VTIEVEFHADPATVLRTAGEFLASKPAAHNLILTLLHTRARYPEPGRYWVVRADGAPVGVVFQSPLDFGSTVTPMPPEAVDAAVRAISDTGIELPGVQGEAATAARFAGQWTERRKGAAEPIEGQRLYEVRAVVQPPSPGGACRQAGSADRRLVEDWMDGFAEVAGQPRGNAVSLVDRLLPAGQFWLWENGQPRSVAAHSDPVAGVTRIQAVYTPPEHRGRGYAAACVADLSQRLLRQGLRCVLYTDLGNPISNSVYRRIGYQAVIETIRYRFD